MNEKGMRLLIATDGSACADAAIDNLERAGLPDNSYAVVFSVADVWTPPALQVPEVSIARGVLVARQRAEKRAEETLRETATIAEKASHRLKEKFPRWQIEHDCAVDSPAWGIIVAAQKFKADLIVVGSHGRSRISRLILGSVSQKVITHAFCSVRVARARSFSSNSPVRLLIGMDGSEEALAAVETVARDRIWPAGSEVLLLSVLDPRLSTASISFLPTARQWINESYEEEENWVERMLEDVSQKLKASGLAVTSRIKDGDPKGGLVEEAVAWNADSIFVGSRGLTTVERYMLGSVSAAVAARAPCSVEIVRKRESLP